MIVFLQYQVNDGNARLLKGIIREDYELAEDCLKTNYYGAKAVTTELLPLLKLSNSARIVNMTGTFGELKVIPSMIDYAKPCGKYREETYKSHSCCSFQWIYNEKVKAELDDEKN